MKLYLNEIFIAVSMSRQGSVIADVRNFYSISSDVKESEVTEAIKNADGALKGAEVEGMSLHVLL